MPSLTMIIWSLLQNKGSPLGPYTDPTHGSHQGLAHPQRPLRSPDPPHGSLQGFAHLQRPLRTLNPSHGFIAMANGHSATPQSVIRITSLTLSTGPSIASPNQRGPIALLAHPKGPTALSTYSTRSYRTINSTNGSNRTGDRAQRPSLAATSHKSPSFYERNHVIQVPVQSIIATSYPTDTSLAITGSGGRPTDTNAHGRDFHVLCTEKHHYPCRTESNTARSPTLLPTLQNRGNKRTCCVLQGFAKPQG